LPKAKKYFIKKINIFHLLATMSLLTISKNLMQTISIEDNVSTTNSIILTLDLAPILTPTRKLLKKVIISLLKDFSKM